MKLQRLTYTHYLNERETVWLRFDNGLVTAWSMDGLYIVVWPYMPHLIYIGQYERKVLESNTLARSETELPLPLRSRLSDLHLISSTPGPSALSPTPS